jgi:hypothetical protein
MACKTRLFSVSFFLTIYFIEYLAWFLYSNEDKLLNGILAGSSFILIAMAMAGYVGIAFVVPTVILFQVVAWWESVNTY